MRELALHILDVAENALQAGASLIRLDVRVDANARLLRIAAADNGCGMSPEVLAGVSDPFFTSRASRRFGFGIALLEQSVLNADGKLTVQSVPGKGTLITAQYPLLHINRPPMGDLAGTLFLLLTCSERCEFIVNSALQEGSVHTLDTRGLSCVNESTARVSRELKARLDTLFPAGFADPWADPTFLSHERRSVRASG